MPSKYSPTSTIYMTPFLEAEALKNTGEQVYELELAGGINPTVGSPPPVAVTYGNSIVYLRGTFTVQSSVGSLGRMFSVPEEIQIAEPTYGQFIDLVAGNPAGPWSQRTWHMVGRDLFSILGQGVGDVFYLDSLYYFMRS